MKEQTKPSLLVKDEEDKQLKSPLRPNPAFHEEYNQQEEGNCFPLFFASFDFLKQRLTVSKQT